jgi:hypothetical protein
VHATEAKLKPLVEASGGGHMRLSDDPDPELIVSNQVTAAYAALNAGRPCA